MTTQQHNRPTVNDLIRLTVETRKAQRMFSDTRDTSWLAKAKNLEKQLDEMLEVITGKPVINERKSNQQSLF